MTNRTRNAIYSALLLLAILIVWQWRQTRGATMIRIEGETMATTYHITYFDPKKRDFKKSIDSVLALVNKSINTYDPTAEISVFNKSKTGIKFSLPYFLPPLQKAREVTEATSGAFDPTVMPLVNAWGFGPDKQGVPDSAHVDSLKNLVGFGKIRFNNDSLWKTDPRTQLDFGGIGQGYGADVITNFLRSKGVENMFVELGGEGMAVGNNTESGKPWEIGILDPVHTQEFKAYLTLSNRSFTTSGNYYNYREVDGQRYSHTIDPATGYPAQRAILSASVFANDCTTADAWATAIMVMGHEKAIEVLKGHPELDVFLVYSAPGGVGTFTTERISGQLEIVK
ncbi:MAG TPA: FAD:protein FMN transferase [Cyclobacteriaceae bacterium]|nr:FAD:protein FMN transferase [Cyclobacteriaceae bacterium]